MIRTIKIALFAILLICCLSIAAPEPRLVQAPDDWTLDINYEQLSQIELRIGKDRKPMRFWYVILTITNNSGQDINFYPMCELVTDTFQIIPSGSQTPPEVFANIQKRHKRTYPFLEVLQPTGIRILEGQDNTKDITVIWPDFDPKAKELSLFIAGLSSETIAVEKPVQDNVDEPITVYLRKTLALNYSISGDPVFRSRPKLTFKGQNWVMR